MQTTDQPQSIEEFAPYIQINRDQVDLLAERLIRKHLLLQYVQLDHPVLRTEEKLVRESSAAVQKNIDITHTDGAKKQLLQMAIFIQVRNALHVLIRLHDVDDDTAETAVYGAEQEAMALITKQPVS